MSKYSHTKLFCQSQTFRKRVWYKQNCVLCFFLEFSFLCQAHYSTGRVGASFTSTAMTPITVHEAGKWMSHSKDCMTPSRQTHSFSLSAVLLRSPFFSQINCQIMLSPLQLRGCTVEMSRQSELLGSAALSSPVSVWAAPWVTFGVTQLRCTVSVLFRGEWGSVWFNNLLHLSWKGGILSIFNGFSSVLCFRE